MIKTIYYYYCYYFHILKLIFYEFYGSGFNTDSRIASFIKLNTTNKMAEVDFLALTQI